MAATGDAERRPASNAGQPRLPEPGLCVSRTPWIAPRLLAGSLLALLAFRFLWFLWRAVPLGSAWTLAPGILATLVLGGCLWWVAHRQAGTGGALIGLSLLVSLPVSLFGRGAVAAPGLFAMLYTAIGVAHALQGPRRKWGPRIVLMAGLSGFTALAAPIACGTGLALSLLAMLYLAEGRRRLLPVVFLLWVGAAGFGYSLRLAALRHGLPHEALSVHPVLEQYIGLGVAALAAVGLWVASRRTRYFGNTAPLIAALVIASASLVIGPNAAVWALPFGLLFIAGVFADGLESSSRRLWTVLAFSAIVLQFALSA